MDPMKLVEIEPRVVPQNLGEIEYLDDLLQRHHLAIVLGRPAEQTEVIHNRFGREAFLHVTRQRRALVAFAHLCAVLIQDERNVRIARRFDAEPAKQRDVLGRVAQVIFAADHVRDAHLQIVRHIDEMKHRLAVGPHDDEIRIQFLAVGQFARHVADDQIGNDHRLARHFEFHRALMVVSQALLLQFLHAPSVSLRALRLKVRPMISFARPFHVAGRRPFVPFETKPAQAVEDHFHRLPRIARGVGVLDAENERAAGVAGVEPVEQRGARAADVQKTGRTRGKSDANVHRSKFKASGSGFKSSAAKTILALRTDWQACFRHTSL